MNMKLTSKFNAGDKVWFFESGQIKFFEGTIKEVQSWDKWSGFRYELNHINSNGETMNFNIEEKNLYASKNDVMTKFFEENGTVQSPEPETTAPSA